MKFLVPGSWFLGSGVRVQSSKFNVSFPPCRPPEAGLEVDGVPGKPRIPLRYILGYSIPPRERGGTPAKLN